jgi:hypothetical protein
MRYFVFPPGANPTTWLPCVGGHEPWIPSLAGADIRPPVSRVETTFDLDLTNTDIATYRTVLKEETKMPLFHNNHPLSPQRSPIFSPLKSNLEEMLKAVQKLEEQLAFFVDDSEAFGLLTEETFLENGPEVLKQLDKLSALMATSTQDIALATAHEDDDSPPPNPGMERMLSLCLHNVRLAPHPLLFLPFSFRDFLGNRKVGILGANGEEQFLSTSARALSTLAAQHRAIRSAAPLAEALARRAAVLRERAAGFKAAMDARSGGDVGGWAAFEGAMGEVGQRFPVPGVVPAAGAAPVAAATVVAAA